MTNAQYKSELVTRAKRLVIGNWKMNGSLDANAALLDGVLAGIKDQRSQATVAVCVPFPYLSQVSGLLRKTVLSWGAQDVSVHDKGAYTGEVSASMLLEFGCQWAIVGHSERRAMHAETAQLVADKAQAAALAGLSPVFCVGESLADREAGREHEVIAAQLEPLFDKGDELVARTVIAYEPVWAIGTGKTATPQQAQDVHAFIRSRLPSTAKDIPLLYGGSVKPDNAATLFAMADIDGGLIGGAALVAQDFVTIATA